MRQESAEFCPKSDFFNCGASAVLRFKEKIRFKFVFLDFNESAIDKDGT